MVMFVQRMRGFHDREEKCLDFQLSCAGKGKMFCWAGGLIGGLRKSMLLECLVCMFILLFIVYIRTDRIGPCMIYFI